MCTVVKRSLIKQYNGGSEKHRTIGSKTTMFNRVCLMVYQPNADDIERKKQRAKYAIDINYLSNI